MSAEQAAADTASATAADQAALVELLAWYREMGVDAALDHSPTDWLVRSAPPGHGFEMPKRAAASAVAVQPAQYGALPAGQAAAPAGARAPAVRAPVVPLAPRTFPSAAPDTAADAARTAAAKAGSLSDLAAALDAFDGCALKPTAKNLCFFRGAQTARLFIIGEAPGRDEDQEGRPVTGADGRLLDAMLKAIGLSAETDAHITNVVYWRPPGNRLPLPQEARVCRPFLDRQIQLVQPKIVLLLGGAAVKFMLDVPDGILRIRGKWKELEVADTKIKTIATLPPSYLIKTPAAKRQAWADLLMVKAALG